MSVREPQSITLRHWLLGIIPLTAIVLCTIARPITLSVMAMPYLVSIIAVLAVILSFTVSDQRRGILLAFGIVTLGFQYVWPGPIFSHALALERLNGPGMDEPGPFRVHEFSEVAGLVVFPYLAIGAGILGGVFARFASRKVWMTTFALIVLGLLIALMLPAEQ